MDSCCLLFSLLLIKLSGTLDVSTVRKISLQRGQSILIPCLYEHEYVHSNDVLSARCYRVLRQHGKLSYQRYNPQTAYFSDNKSHKFCIVRMDNVQESGDFWCGVLPHVPNKQTNLVLKVTAGLSGLYVTNQNLTVFENDSVTVNCHHHVKHYVEWCTFGEHCMSRTSETKDGAFVEIRYSRTVMTVTMNKLKMENTGWYSCSSKDLQMPVFITVQQKMSPTPTKPRKRTAVLFLLPVILEVLLVISMYASWRLFKLWRERCLISRKQEAEDAQYVTMHRKRSSHQTGCADVCDGTYEKMAGVKSNIEVDPDYVNVTKT
ncbi:uncharacterized protein si:ch1073-59l16.1 [Triplophysa dalaica]|uniref:uncharacterized protein si:ch1073-59l16.1 n=1 Tax=Triplophysa dalaica TaxID=1582913 RepID=UPI0024E01ACD|nr:uncharacterized protein si:ch1073-59l16.1 [Triplophysa dalaica]